MNCLIYQNITTPDGLLSHHYKPEVGRRNDTTLYKNAGMDSILQHAMMFNGIQCCIYGDAAYILWPWLQVAFRRSSANTSQLIYNKGMSSVREGVEWSYKEVKESCTSQELAPIGKLHICSVLLRNRKTCLGYGGQVASIISVPPPSL